MEGTRGAPGRSGRFWKVPGPCSTYSTAVAPTRLTGQSTHIGHRSQEGPHRERAIRHTDANASPMAGSGAIACGLAATAAHHGPVLLLARSRSSAERARATVEQTLAARSVRRSIRSTCRSSPTRSSSRRRDVRRRGGRRGPRRQGRPAGRADAILDAARDPREHHLVAVDRAARRGQRAPAAIRRACTCSTRSRR